MAANGAGAGYFATLTAAQLDQDAGDDFRQLATILDRIHRRYQGYWLAMGTDPTFGYSALKQLTGVTTTQANTDYGNVSTAYSLGEKLYWIVQGAGTIAADGTNGGNGTVTIGALGSGFNFQVFFSRVCGDTVV